MEVAASLICTCGALKVKKNGTRLVSGHEVCNRCGLPLEFSAAAIAEASPRRIERKMVTTLAEVPGFRTIEVHGLVTELTSAAGFTAASKGKDALSMAMPGLTSQATALGANAIVGFQASVFGAAGGITGVLGGDAVGVLLLGTAVTVEP